ncbi:MAG: hypothetical protein M0P97_02765 [Candidatus Moranbacteria bacterium]|jgi:hypothetical protein|nr:hypothetical protein [Candidatus Moranbacteria bacterium]
MKENEKKLVEILNGSNLSKSDKMDWVDFFAFFPGELQKTYLEIFSSFPEKIEWFNEIMQKKKSAMEILKNDKEKGEEMMRQIVAEEKEEIEKMIQ